MLHSVKSYQKSLFTSKSSAAHGTGRSGNHAFTRNATTNTIVPSFKVQLLLRRMIGSCTHIVCLDVPLLLILCMYATMLHIKWIGTNYLIPQIQLQRFDHSEQQSLTYYHRICNEYDQTTNDTVDLVVDIGQSTGSSISKDDTDEIDDFTTAKKIDIAVQKMMQHGVTIIPDLISEGTATTLRDYIIEQNTIRKPEDMIGVIAQKFRWSFAIQVDENPIIATALEEILHHPNLITYLEAMMGSDPAVTEFTAITQAYGAVEQRWHEDVVPSGSMAKYGRSFVPTYNLFIPLQNVTDEMGATWICPGTYMCSESEFCPDTGFQASGSSKNWPLGSGVFLHQQTTHRGGAHRDPNGPERVVFILTLAPRSRVFTPTKIVETRKFGLGGSYSLHFSHWGHTLTDYQQPLKYMKQPFRTLRSLGVYNNRGTNHWGWDYITVCTGRLGNNEGGCPTARELQRKLAKAIVAIAQLHQIFIGVYIGFILLFALLLRWRQGKWSKSLIHDAFRLWLIHTLVICVAWMLRQHVKRSIWGRNIKANRSFRLSNNHTPLAASLPATQPEDRDIMIFEGMQSNSQNSYTRVLEVVHPGNKEWNNLVRYFAGKYFTLSLPLQEHVRRQLLDAIRAGSRRILIQNDESNWTPASTETRHWFSHKRLLQLSNHHINDVIQNLDYLFAETRYGYFRNSVLHQKHISQLLTSLRKKIFGIVRQRMLNTMGVTVHRKVSMLTAQSFSTLHDRHLTLRKASNIRRSSFPYSDTPMQPNVWLNVGDVAEVTFGDNEGLEWYRGTITYANSNSGTWDVRCDDGDEIKNACRRCVRPFIPFVVNETIDVLLDTENVYTFCHVLSIQHQSDNTDSTKYLLYDVQLDDESNRILTRIPMKDLRRNYRHVLARIPIYSHVMVKLQYDDETYSSYETGQIIKFHFNLNSYDILLADGEVLSNVSRHDIKLIKPST